MEDPRQTAQTLIEQHSITLKDLWVRYWANGGDATEPELEDYLNGVQDMGPFDLKILSWAIEDLKAS